MRKVYLLILILSSVSCFGQYKSYSECETAKKDAIKLSENGFYRIQSFGDLPDDYQSESWRYTQVYLFTKHGITIEERGCISSTSDICFDEETDRLIEEKFGLTFLTTLQRKLKKDILKFSEKEKAEIVDQNKTYEFWIDSPVKYNGNDLELRNLVKEKLELNGCFKANNDFWIAVDINGRVEDLNYHNSDSNEIALAKNELMKIFSDELVFVPAYLYGLKVKSKYYLNF